MGLSFYLSEAFIAGDIIDPIDSFIGDGVTSTFVLVNKSVQRLASTITVDGNQYYQYNGGFTKDILANSFTLSVIPPFNSQIVAPGITQLVSDVFDQDPVPGVVDPLVSEKAFWFGDTTDIQNQYYTGLPSLPGIQISLTDLISSIGAQTSWCQFASADPTTGLAMTYEATGAILYTAPINAFGTLTASAANGASSVMCAEASSFLVGDYLYLNVGGGNQEIRKVSTLSASSIGFTTNFDFSHASGETIMTMGRKAWLKVTMPVNAANNTATNFYDLALRGLGRIVSRV